jgi:hypothetical protein
MLPQDRQFVQLVDIACVSSSRYTKLEVSNVLIWRITALLWTIFRKQAQTEKRPRSLAAFDFRLTK